MADTATPTYNPAAALLEAGVFPAAPGTYLGRYVMARYKDDPQAAAASMELPVGAVFSLLHDELTIDDYLAERLASYAHTTPEFWIGMQQSWDYAKRMVPADARGSYIQVEPYAG